MQYIVFFMSLALVAFLVDSTPMCFDGEEVTIYQKIVIIFGYSIFLFWVAFILLDFIRNLIKKK